MPPRPDPRLGARVLMGSARPVDGRMPVADYLAWVAGVAASGPVVYLPHRREPAAQLDAVRAIAGVRVSDARLPAELVLAGAPGAVNVYTLPSSTATTLPPVLGGARFAIRTASARPEGITA